jgi:hypothetical protein
MNIKEIEENHEARYKKKTSTLKNGTEKKN